MSVDIEIRVRPEKDSDNSYPGTVTFQVVGAGTVRVDLHEPERTLLFSPEAWKRIVAALAI